MNLPFKVGISPTLNIRGIIATETIKPGQIIEKCPTILYDNQHHPTMDQTLIKKYYFEWNKKQNCIVLGYGSIFNHSYTPNACYDPDYKNKLMIFKTLKQINPGEEILVNYNWDPESQEALDPELLDFNKHYK